ncbi:hypothetical protein NBRC116597_27190 [Phaeobacter sp. NW0010-22]
MAAKWRVISISQDQRTLTKHNCASNSHRANAGNVTWHKESKWRKSQVDPMSVFETWAKYKRFRWA